MLQKKLKDKSKKETEAELAKFYAWADRVDKFAFGVVVTAYILFMTFYAIGCAAAF